MSRQWRATGVFAVRNEAMITTFAIDEFVLRAQEMDFDASQQNAVEVTRVSGGGTVLINALEYIDHAEGGFQIHVCEDCGQPG